jgi:alkylated DNA repair dioxygenase AlkB
MTTAVLALPPTGDEPAGVELGGWQASLLGGGEPAFDATFPGIERHRLAHGAWVDHSPGWLAGSDSVFERVLARAPWGRRAVEMYGERVIEPRLTARFPVSDPPVDLHVLSDVGAALSHRYAVGFASIGCNLYRDGHDSVAWHGDRIARDRPTATIAIVSLGERRPFRLRPRGGGRSVGFELGRGDLLVMGGTCQRTWQHTVPKVAEAGPRISVTYRHHYDG